MIEYGCQSMVAPLRRVLVRRPDEAFTGADPERWHYTAPPDPTRAGTEHDALVAMLRDDGCTVEYHDEPLPGHADSIYVFDPVLVTERGTVTLSMGKDLRRGEEAVLTDRLEALGIPRLFALDGNARAEGGDLLWIDRTTLVAGLGFRTNPEGVAQLRRGLSPLGVEVLTTELPFHTGPAACLHLLSSISMLADDLAVVYPPLLTVPFLQLLEARGIQTVTVPEAEYATMAPNVLVTAPRRCIALEGNPITRARMEAAGCHVRTYRGDEISLKAEGGPTCLTRPILRAS